MGVMIAVANNTGMLSGFHKLIQVRHVARMPQMAVLAAVVIIFNPLGRSWALQQMTLIRFQAPPLPSGVTLSEAPRPHL